MGSYQNPPSKKKAFQSRKLSSLSLLALPALKRVYCPSTMGGFAMTTLRMTRFNSLPTALSVDGNETRHSRNMECGHCEPTHSGREVSTPAPPRAKADGPRPSGLKPARPWPAAAPVTPAPPARPPPARFFAASVFFQLEEKSVHFLFLKIRDRSWWSRDQEVSKLGNCLDLEC